MILAKLPLQPFAPGMPVVAIDFFHHDFDHGNAVLLCPSTALPEALSRRPQKAGRTAKPLRQLLRKPSNHPYRSAAPCRSLWEQDLHEVRDADAHEAGAGACLRASYQQGMRSHGFDLFADVVHMDIQPGWVSSAELQSVGPLARGITPIIQALMRRCSTNSWAARSEAAPADSLPRPLQHSVRLPRAFWQLT